MSIYQHFRPEEQPFVDLVLGWKDDVETQYKTVLTDFLDPREQLIFESVIGKQSDLNLTFFGGYDKAERKRAILAPFYEVEIGRASCRERVWVSRVGRIV